jgi:hypothetical protein
MNRIQDFGYAQSVMLFHFGRCGSTALADSLGSHPSICWHNEIFTPGSLICEGYNASQWPSRLALGQLTTEEFANYITYCCSHFPSDERNYWFGKKLVNDSVYAFELKFQSFAADQLKFSIESLLTQSRELGIDTFIYLERQNALRRIVSNLIAETTGIYHLMTQPTTAPTRVRLDVQSVGDWGFNYARQPLLTALEYDDKIRKQTRSLFRNTGATILCYENDIEHKLDDTCKSILRALELAPSIRPTIFIKQNCYPLSSLVINFEELCRTLRDTPYEFMLHDGC